MATVSAAVAATTLAPHRVLLAISGVAVVAAAIVDHHEFRLPNQLVGIAAAAALIGAGTTLNAAQLASCLVGGLICGAAMLTLHLHRGVGMGDVKAATAVGMSCGSVAAMIAPAALAIGALTAAVTGLITGRSRLAMGPSFAVGWVVALGTSGWWLR